MTPVAVIAEDEAALAAELAQHLARLWPELRVAAVAPDGVAALAASSTPVDAALVSLVDLPGLPSAAVRRVLGERAGRTGAVRQAEYAGRPGHPVLIGRAHWTALSDHLDGAAADPSSADRGAGAWLRAVGAEPVPCADLWDGADQDRVSGP